jgi:DNA polymerase-3 subunit delta
VYLLFGEESYLVERALATVLERLAVAGKGLAVHVRSGDEHLVARVEEALRTRPLFGGRPVAIVHDVDVLPPAEQEGLLAALPGAEGGHLVCVGRAPDLRRRLFAACVREGWGFEFRRLPLGRLPAWLREEAARRGHDLGTDAAEMLVELVGGDLGACAGEIEKLSLYVGPKAPIRCDDVAAVVGASRLRSAFELSDFLQRREMGPALAIVRRVLQQGERPIGLAALLAGQLRRMLVARSLAAAGASPDEVARRLRLPPWVADRITQGARRYGPHELEAAAAGAADLDVSLKSSRRPAAILLEAFLLGLQPRGSATRATTRATRGPGS